MAQHIPKTTYVYSLPSPDDDEKKQAAFLSSAYQNGVDFANKLNICLGYPPIDEDNNRETLTGSWTYIAKPTRSRDNIEWQLQLQFPQSSTANLYITRIVYQMIQELDEAGLSECSFFNDSRTAMQGIRIGNLAYIMSKLTHEALDDIATQLIIKLNEILTKSDSIPEEAIAIIREKKEQLEKTKKNRSQIIASLEVAGVAAEQRHTELMQNMPGFIAAIKKLHDDTLLAISSTKDKDMIDRGLKIEKSSSKKEKYKVIFLSGLAQYFLVTMHEHGVSIPAASINYRTKFAPKIIAPYSFHRLTPQDTLKLLAITCEQYKKHLQAFSKDVSAFTANNPDLDIKSTVYSNGVDCIIVISPCDLFSNTIITTLLNEKSYGGLVFNTNETPTTLLSTWCQLDQRTSTFIQKFRDWQKTWKGKLHLQIRLLASILKEIENKCSKKSWQMWGSGSEIKTRSGAYGVPRHYAKIYQDIQTCLAEMEANEQHLEPEQIFNHYKDTIDRILAILEESIKTKDDFSSLFRSTDTVKFDQYLQNLINTRLAFLNSLPHGNDQKDQEPSHLEGKEAKVKQ